MDDPFSVVLIVALFALVLASFTRRRRPDDALEERIRRVERSVDRLSHYTGMVPDPGAAGPDSLSDPVREALSRGSKIEAIRLYREENGVGLKGAKEAVEAFERSREGPSRPDR